MVYKRVMGRTSGRGYKPGGQAILKKQKIVPLMLLSKQHPMASHCCFVISTVPQLSRALGGTEQVSINKTKINIKSTYWLLNRPKPAVKDPGICPACASLPFTQKGDIYAQIVKQNKTFPTILKPARLDWWSLRYAPKRFKILVKNSEENFPFPPFACPW